MKKFNYLSFVDAYELALKEALGQKSTQIMLVSNSINAVLAEDVMVQKNLPSFDNSAMDGFAFNYENKGKTLTIAATIFAGDSPEPILSSNTCYKIMTGAKVPNDADTIVPIEDCIDVSEQNVTIPENIKKHNAFRPKGEEQSVGNTLFKKGEMITPGHVALLASQGIMGVTVYRPLSIAVVATGDELKEPWEKANEDEIYNSNASAITSLLEKYGFQSTYAGSIPDSLEKSTVFISKLKSYDVIITTGGISMGDADFLEEAFINNGLEVLFHGIDVKPGRPTMMGAMGDTFVMAMPGNPLTAMINTFLLSVPILSKLQGKTAHHHDFVYAKNTKSFNAKPGRANVVLGHMNEGKFTVTRNNKYGSGMMIPIVESNALVVLDKNISLIEEGDFVKVILFDLFPSALAFESLN
ncbi:MAG: molybdopterin molybdenumtransferase MoeA [Sulfurovum sp.]|nr:MAG: molybdopterin molybdenumtransferase MoeA [Sulfurovum sp.]